MSEDTQRQTRATQADDEEEAGAQTLPRGCSCHVDAARRKQRRKRDRREGIAAFGEIVEAHESVKADWTEHPDRRPDDVREQVWYDPLHTPVDPTEKEEKFICTRRIRRRNLRWKRGGQA